MKKEELKELLRKRAVKTSSLALAAVIAVGSLWASNQQSTVIPELVTYVDMEQNVVIEGEEVPLAAPTVTTSTKTTKKTKKIKMKKASKKTYIKTGKTKKKTKTKKSKTKSATTTTKTVTATTVTDNYTKGSKVNNRVTTVQTTVTKTVVSKELAVNKQQPANTTNQAVKNQAVTNTPAYANGPVSIKTVAPKLDGRVISAYETLHFTININSGVSYSGKFSSREQGITLKKVNDTVYHEVGHFVAFIAGNVDLAPEFQSVYNKEKSRYTASNKSYVLSSSAEYFAESFKEYTLNPAALKAARPETYAAMESALNRITGAQVSAVWNMYKSFWK